MDLVEAASGKEAKNIKEQETTEIKPEAAAEEEDQSALYLSLKAATTAESSSRYAGGGKWFGFYGLIHDESEGFSFFPHRNRSRR